MSHNAKLSKEQCPTTQAEANAIHVHPYRSLVGELLYIAMVARPDILSAVNIAAQFSDNYGTYQWNELMHIVKYLITSKELKLALGGDEPIELRGYADASFHPDIDDTVSRTGFVVFCGQSPIAWGTHKQHITSLST